MTCRRPATRTHPPSLPPSLSRLLCARSSPPSLALSPLLPQILTAWLLRLLRLLPPSRRASAASDQKTRAPTWRASICTHGFANSVEGGFRLQRLRSKSGHKDGPPYAVRRTVGKEILNKVGRKEERSLVLRDGKNARRCEDDAAAGGTSNSATASFIDEAYTLILRCAHLLTGISARNCPSG
eukprot:6206982-Pleurochrysis_carterae.AAC.1